MINTLRAFALDAAGFLSDENRKAAAGWVEPDRAKDRRLLVLIGVGAISLLIQHYLVVNMGTGLPLMLWRLGFEDAARGLHAAFTDPADGNFILLLSWASGVITVLLLLPAIAVKLTGARLADFGLRVGHGDARVYALLFLLMLPLVAGAAMTPDFSSYYPFYKVPDGQPLWPRLAIWEAAYAVQFLAVEFFFRGVLVHGARHRFGAWAILLPLLPYMMIHFGKPWPESAGAVVAGLVLGYLSLRTGSVLYGAMLHIGVALTMDFTALAVTGRLF
jgi:membrane protease YdiL (CAAX protease family)